MKKYSNILVKNCLAFLLIISLIGSLNYIFIEINYFNSKKIVIFYFILFLLFSFCLSHSYINALMKFLEKKKSISYGMLVLFCVFLLIYQINMIWTLSGIGRSDSGMLIRTILHLPMVKGWSKIYYSYFPNNLLLLVIENSIWQCVKLFLSVTSYIHLLNIINMFLIDLGSVFLGIACKNLFNKVVGYISFISAELLLGFSLHIIEPYTDIWTFFFGSVFIFLISFPIKQQQFTLSFKNILSIIMLALLIPVMYLMKPSSLVYMIGLTIICIGHVVGRENNNIKNIIITMIVFSAISIPTFSGLNYVCHRNGIVSVETSKKESMLHFIAMGQTGTGGFNSRLTLDERKLEAPKEKIKYNKRELKKELKNYQGIDNYLAFLIKKQQSNTSYSVWPEFDVNPLKNRHLTNRLQRFQYDIYFKHQDEKLIQWNIGIQLWWTLIIIGCLLTGKMFSWRIQLLKYVILGGFVFLLIFEGGRSRYMIQYLPVIISLGSLGLGSLGQSLMKRYNL